MTDISLILAFSAGVLSFLSPCVLPLIPAYITYLTSSVTGELHAKKNKLNILKKSLGFVLGFTVVFVLLGASASTLGKLVASNQNFIRKIGGIVVIIFGLHTLGIFKVKFFYYEKRLLPFDKIRGSWGSIFMGIAFAIGWTPCIGPILSAILIYASNMDTLGRGIILLISYSLGLGIPFILSAILVNTYSIYFKKLSKFFPILSVVSGLLMIAMGIIIYLNKVNILSKYFNFIKI